MACSARSKAADLLGSELVVVNVGLDIFYQSMVQQKVKAVQVSLPPSPALDKRLSAALDKIL